MPPSAVGAKRSAGQALTHALVVHDRHTSASTAMWARAPTSDGGILFNYEECFECGTCYMVCDSEGAITWTYPDGGHGVVFHHG